VSLTSLARQPRSHRPGRSALVAGVLAACTLAAGLGTAVGTLGQTRPAAEDVRVPAGPDSVASRSSARGTEPHSATEEQSKPAAQAISADAQLITTGVTVQVLNATRAARADNRMATRLEKLGYTIVAINPAATRYRTTTVFWSRRAGRAAALALASRFGWSAARRPANLSDSVTIHVVVGGDEV
jgi:LytR cell envelope-related transcriptional attenuator